MAANTAPIYSRQGDIQYVEGITTANTTRDLTSGTIYLVFTADATEGGYVEFLRFTSKGANVSSLGRIWINNGGATGTAANNWLLGEVNLPLTNTSEVTATPPVEFTLGFAMPPGYRIYVTIGTAVASGYHAGVVGGKY